MSYYIDPVTRQYTQQVISEYLHSQQPYSFNGYQPMAHTPHMAHMAPIPSMSPQPYMHQQALQQYIQLQVQLALHQQKPSPSQSNSPAAQSLQRQDHHAPSLQAAHNPQPMASPAPQHSVIQSNKSSKEKPKKRGWFFRRSMSPSKRSSTASPMSAPSVDTTAKPKPETAASDAQPSTNPVVCASGPSNEAAVSNGVWITPDLLQNMYQEARTAEKQYGESDFQLKPVCTIM